MRIGITRGFALVVAFVCTSLSAYEINNHADMSQTAAEFSVLGDNAPNGKLFRLGLKTRQLGDPGQTFSLSRTVQGFDLGPIPYCFGSNRPAQWKVTIPFGDSNFPSGQQDGTVAQPNWLYGGTPQLTIAQLIRYGACYEDEEEPYARSISHFYNPQAQGASAPLGPSSLDWMLKRNPGSSLKSGDNHYTWMDARDSFYYALTGRKLDPSNPIAYTDRQTAWGRTFHGLGHIVHHLQDMASPQHVRADYHCNSVKECQESWVIPYRPSGYEVYWEARFNLIKNLAATASAPIMFGLPREFWNMRTDNDLATSNPTEHASANQGIALYTSTNFTSAGKDFHRIKPLLGPGEYRPAPGLPFPKPHSTPFDVNVSELFPAENLATVRDVLCGGTTTNCVMPFMGTEVNPTARTSAMSYFSKELLVPSDPNNPSAPTYSGPGVFSQNFFTYTDAANKLIPAAVSYSAGLINYFFRGELEIKLPEEGVYGIVDHAVEKNKDSDGFRLIKAKVKNATPPVTMNFPRADGTSIIAQHMREGGFIAVAKFHRNSCYSSPPPPRNGAAAAPPRAPPFKPPRSMRASRRRSHLISPLTRFRLSRRISLFKWCLRGSWARKSMRS
jgi:hypothetical protein